MLISEVAGLLIYGVLLMQALARVLWMSVLGSGERLGFVLTKGPGELAPLRYSLIFLGIVLALAGYATYYVGAKVKINPWVGFRIPSTYRDPKIWRAVNVRSGLFVILWGIGLAFLGLLVDVALPIFMLSLFVPLLAIVVDGIIHARRLEKAKEPKPTDWEAHTMRRLRKLSIALGPLLIVLALMVYWVGITEFVNPYVGFRIPATLKDPVIWRKVNVASSIGLGLHGILLLAVGLLVRRMTLQRFLLVMCVPLLINTILGVIYAVLLAA